MAINFDSLPNDKGSAGKLIPQGTYFAKVEAAEMKAPKDPNKPEYLNMRYSLKTAAGESVGNLFDALYESDHQLLKYKLKRFLLATGIELSGEFELKDLAKLVVGKEFIVDVTVQSSEGYSDKSVADIFTGEIYYNLSEANSIFGGDTIINAPDALDNTDTEEEF